MQSINNNNKNARYYEFDYKNNIGLKSRRSTFEYPKTCHIHPPKNTRYHTNPLPNLEVYETENDGSSLFRIFLAIKHQDSKWLNSDEVSSQFLAQELQQEDYKNAIIQGIQSALEIYLKSITETDVSSNEKANTRDTLQELIASNFAEELY